MSEEKRKLINEDDHPGWSCPMQISADVIPFLHWRGLPCRTTVTPPYSPKSGGMAGVPEKAL